MPEPNNAEMPSAAAPRVSADGVGHHGIDAIDPADPTDPVKGIPDATVARLPVYLQALGTFAANDTETVSSDDLAEVSGVNSAKLRKDLSYLGPNGTRGVGYDVDRLVRQISQTLGLTLDWRVVIVGVGHLGRALAGYPGFGSRGFSVVGMFDVDKSVVGEDIGGLRVRDIAELETGITQTQAKMAVLAVPASAAQDICNRMVEAGIHGILNFAPCVLQVPDHVQLRRVDLATELQILAFHAGRQVASDLLAGKVSS